LQVVRLKDWLLPENCRGPLTAGLLTRFRPAVKAHREANFGTTFKRLRGQDFGEDDTGRGKGGAVHSDSLSFIVAWSSVSGTSDLLSIPRMLLSLTGSPPTGGSCDAGNQR
jgi:hypothetical protein